MSFLDDFDMFSIHFQDCEQHFVTISRVLLMILFPNKNINDTSNRFT